MFVSNLIGVMIWREHVYDRIKHGADERIALIHDHTPFKTMDIICLVY